MPPLQHPQLPGELVDKVRALSVSHERLRALLNALPDLLFELDAQGRLVDCLTPDSPLLLMPVAQFVGRTVDAVMPPEVARVTHAGLAQAARSGQALGLTYSLDTPQGLRHFELAIVRWQPPASQQPAFLALVHDVSDRARAAAQDAALAESEARYRMAFDASVDAVNINRLSDGLYLDVNQGFEALTGWTRSEVLGRTSAEVAIWNDPQDRSKLVDALQREGQCVNLEAAFRMRSGQLRWGLMSAKVLTLQGQACILSITRDITERREAQQHIEHLLHYDALTGLPNRAEAQARFDFMRQMAQRRAEPLALLFVDLDHFKAVNDALGHSLGDRLLVEVAQRLLSSVRVSDTCARLGADEFIVLVPGASADQAAAVAAKLLAELGRACVIDGRDLAASASIGIAMAPDDGEDFETLARHADAALNRAKADGRNGFAFYEPQMQDQTLRRLQLMAALRGAAERGELSLHYQPQVDLRSDRVLGAEALLRWNHPSLGAVSPAEFIPVAESSGLIVSLGAWVLRQALAQWRAWADAGLPALVLAVNVSALQLRDPDFPALVARLLRQYQVAPHWLEIELTEAATMADPQAASAMMALLHAQGVRLAIDDFGTGYSNLSHLKRFQVYKLKIDQSFVRDIDADPEDRAIVSAVVRLAQALGLQTLAEGVETPSQLAYLHAQGCQEVQGYHYSRPLAAHDFAHWLRERSADPGAAAPPIH